MKKKKKKKKKNHGSRHICILSPRLLLMSVCSICHGHSRFLMCWSHRGCVCCDGCCDMAVVVCDGCGGVTVVGGGSGGGGGGVVVIVEVVVVVVWS